MKMKKVYIGAAAIISILIIVIASVFYIKANNKDVKVAEFSKNLTEENTREAMLEENAENTNEENQENKDSNESSESEKQEENQEAVEQKQEPTEQNEASEEKVEVKEFEVTPMEKTLYVKASSLNVRSGPGTSYSKIGALSWGSQISVTGKTSNWYRINYNGKVGYVREDYTVATKPEPEPEPESSSSSVDSSSSVGHLIIINSRRNTLRYYVSGKLVRSYSCATGAGGTPTPQGKFSIFEKLENRPYYKAGIKGGAPNNPLGPRWMQFKSGGYAIHGTNVDSSIGNNVSHGCVRMHNQDVIELYSMVPYGTTVIVKNTSQSDKEIAAGYGIYLE